MITKNSLLNNKKNIVVLNVFFSILIFSFNWSFSLLFFQLFFYSTGLFLSRKSQIGSSIYSLFFLIYSVFGTSVYIYGIFYDLDFVHASDQITFYLQSEDHGQLDSYWILVKKSIEMVLVNWNGGSALTFGTISYFANQFLDGNHFLLHIFSICLASSLSLFYLFKTLTLYFNLSKSVKYTIIFGVFSYLFYYSGFLLRDVFIALFYMIAIYLYHENKLNYKTIIKFGLLALITYSFRNENGLFLFLFLFFYIFNSQSSLKRNFLLTTIILFLIYSSSILFLVYENSIETFEIYNEFSNKRIDNLGSDSLITKLDKLPTGIKEISMIGFKLMYPFPFWDFFNFKIGDIIFINISLAGIFSYYINGFIIITIIFFRKHFKIKKSLIYLIIIAYSLILLNLSNLDTRRIFYVYPILFIFFLVLSSQIKKKKYINTFLIALYSILTIIYVLLKYLI